MPDKLLPFTDAGVKICRIIYSYLLVGWIGGRTVSVPEPEYSVQGYASATVSHAAAHKVHISQRKLTFLLEHMDLNAGGLKVPL